MLNVCSNFLNVRFSYFKKKCSQEFRGVSQSSRTGWLFLKVLVAVGCWIGGRGAGIAMVQTAGYMVMWQNPARSADTECSKICCWSLLKMCSVRWLILYCWPFVTLNPSVIVLPLKPKPNPVFYSSFCFSLTPVIFSVCFVSEALLFSCHF